MISPASFCVALGLISPVAAEAGYGLDWIQQRSVETVAIPAFNYGVLKGPLNWHNINESYYLCGNGTNQSPILLNSTSTHSPSAIALDIPIAQNVVFENLGTTVEVVINGSLWAGNSSWTLAQFHFHTPSEHRIDLKHSDVEMHLLFTAADGSGKFAVVGFFIEASDLQSTEVLETVFAHLHDIKTPGTTTIIPKLDFTSFQGQANSMTYFHYMGSLTTPPCTEGVAWYLGTAPLPLRLGTYDRLKNLTQTNNRYAQNTIGQTNILQIAAMGL